MEYNSIFKKGTSQLLIDGNHEIDGTISSI